MGSSQAQNKQVKASKYSVNLVDRMITAIVRPDAPSVEHMLVSDRRAALVRSGLLSLYN